MGRLPDLLPSGCCLRGCDLGGGQAAGPVRPDRGISLLPPPPRPPGNPMISNEIPPGGWDSSNFRKLSEKNSRLWRRGRDDPMPFSIFIFPILLPPATTWGQPEETVGVYWWQHGGCRWGGGTLRGCY